MRQCLKFALLLICFSAVQILAACSFPGQKLLSMEVSHQGEKVLITQFAVDDTSGINQIWDAACEAPVGSEVKGGTPALSGASTLEVALSGPVEIVIMHVDSVEAQVTLTGVVLERSSLSASDWRLSRGDLSRVKGATAQAKD